MSARRVLVVIVAVALLASGGTAWASHQFNDVPNDSQFHDAIAAIRGAGITTGFPDGGYHPNDPVTRAAMAAFMSRGFGRVGFDEDNISIDDSNTPTTVTDTAITAGATGSGGGFVQVTGTATIATDNADDECPCLVFLSIWDGTTTLGSVSGVLSNDDLVFGEQTTLTMSTNAVYPIPAGTTRTYRLRGTFLDASDDVDITFDGGISAVYVPFGPTGGNTL
jgi:hypothetical protein